MDRIYKTNGRKDQRKKKRMKLRRLNFVILEDNLMYQIFSYLDVFADLVPLAACSTAIRKSVLQNRIWGDLPIDICVSRGCFECGRNKLSLTNTTAICAETVLAFIRLHLTMSSIPTFLRALSVKKTVKRMHLRISSNMRYQYFNQAALAQTSITLQALTVYGWPRVPNLPAYPFLKCVGAQLVSLKFMEGAPCDLLYSLAETCPRLQSLVIEGSQELSALLAYRSSSLLSLCLYDTGIRLAGRLSLEGLVKFELVNSELDLPKTLLEVQQLVHALPRSLKELELKLPCLMANESVVEIGSRLPLLEHLVLRLPLALPFPADATPPDISHASLSVLIKGCPSLRSLEIGGEMVGLTPSAFLSVREFLCLRRMRLIYEDSIVDLLPELLRASEELEEVIFYENAIDFIDEGEEGGVGSGGEEWERMGERLQAISEAFPAVKISLADHWWT